MNKFLKVIHKAPQSTPIENYDDKWKFSLDEKFVFKSQVVETFDNFILDSLYQEFLESEASHLVLIDKQEFNKFLMKYLPMYLEDKHDS